MSVLTAVIQPAEKSGLDIRDPGAALGILIDPWLHEARHSSAVRGVRDREYVPDQRRLILEILQTAEVLVACAQEDMQHIYGYVAFGPGDVLHWVYVKSAYQRLGLGDRLLKAAFPHRRGLEPVFATQVSSIEKWKWLASVAARRGIYYRPHLLLRAS